MIFSVTFLYSPVFACDPCALHANVDSVRQHEGDFSLGITEQYSHSGRLQEDNKTIANPENIFLNTSTTHLYAKYAFTNSIAGQLYIPFIYRSFRKEDEGSVERGSESGLGDVILLGRWRPFERATHESFIAVELFGGLKLPTGDASRLSEGRPDEEEHHEAALRAELKHGETEHGTSPAIHGHDLALGTGSVDFPIGASVFLQRTRLFIAGEVQYTLRTEGSFEYEYADDFLWNIGPGYYPIFRDNLSVGTRVVLSGDHRSRDKADGVLDDSTALEGLYLGPQVLVRTSNISATFGIEFPLDIDNSGTQAVVEHRLKGALVLRF